MRSRACRGSGRLSAVRRLNYVDTLGHYLYMRPVCSRRGSPAEHDKDGTVAAGGSRNADLRSGLPSLAIGLGSYSDGRPMTAIRPTNRCEQTSVNIGTAQDDSFDEPLVPPVAAADPHLLDTNFGRTLSKPQEKHLACCGWCQQRFTQAKVHPDLADEEAFLAAARALVASGAGAELEKLTVLRPALHALTGTRDDRDEIEIGQLWRLRWRETTEIALVVAVDRWWVTVAPVTTDIGAADEYGVILPGTSTVLGIPAAVCFSLECVVPLFTFDHLIARVGRPEQAEGNSLTQLPSPETLRDVWRAWRRGTTPPQLLTYGQPLLEGDLDRRELRGTLAAGFSPLVSASALAPGQSTRQPSAPLSAMLQDLQIPPSELARRTNLEREVFLRVRQGGRVTATEAHALTAVLDTDTETILAANPPLDESLVVEVSQPRWRPDLRRLAELRYTSEDEERWGLADAVAASPRRTVHERASADQTADATAGQSASEWAPIVEMHLRAKLAELGASNAR